MLHNTIFNRFGPKSFFYKKVYFFFLFFHLFLIPPQESSLALTSLEQCDQFGKILKIFGDFLWV